MKSGFNMKNLAAKNDEVEGSFDTRIIEIGDKKIFLSKAGV